MIDYDAYYRDQPGVDGERSSRWRELSAIGKADHVTQLLARAGRRAPGAVLEVGCGDGAVLAELGRRGLGPDLVGVEVSSSAAELAASRPEIDRVQTFDGVRLPFADASFELVLATHVLEHVEDPLGLLREMRRVASALVFVEVPLETNLAAQRPAAIARSVAAGHVQRFRRADVRQLLTQSGLTLAGEISDPLPRAVRTFTDGEVRGTLKWAVRSLLALSPAVGERLMTVHYAALGAISPPTLTG
ncbi:MAG: class I SAM-dependent methyltransferase [Solirubrobacteraceae bacterium]|jgi:SAM-dependent methyltransferase